MQRAEFAMQRVALRRCVFPKDAIVEFDLNVVAWIFEWYQREVCGWLRHGCVTCIWVSDIASELAASIA